MIEINAIGLSAAHDLKFYHFARSVWFTQLSLHWLPGGVPKGFQPHLWLSLSRWRWGWSCSPVSTCLPRVSYKLGTCVPTFPQHMPWCSWGRTNALYKQTGYITWQHHGRTLFQTNGALILLLSWCRSALNGGSPWFSLLEVLHGVISAIKRFLAHPHFELAL